MKNYKYIFIVLICIFAACGEKEAEAPKPITEKETKAEPAVMPVTFNDTAAIAEMKEKPVETGMLDPKGLEPFLPNEVTDFRKLPADYGWSANDVTGFSSVTYEYLGKKGGTFSIALFDFGSTANIPDEKYFYDLPEEAGYVTSKVSVKKGVAYQLWDDSKRSGKLRALIKNRFMIKIDANMMPVHGYDLKSLFDMIKIDELLR